VRVKSPKKDPAAEEGDNNPAEEPWERTLKSTTVTVGAAEFRGRRVSLWELLHCRYIPEESRTEILELYRAGELSLEQVKSVLSTIVTRAAAAAA
ncbi:EPIPL protein, partial [Spelaeornis formosus]|nr:EPIPL protein [Elachura formosa]